MKKPTKTKARATKASATAGASLGRLPSAQKRETAAAASPAGSGRWRSEGQRLLCERPESGPKLAQKLGTTRASVSAWRTGSKRPSPEAQREMEKVLSIPRSAWRDRPQRAAGSAPSAPRPASVDKAGPPTPTAPASDVFRRPRIPLSDEARTNLDRIEELLEEVEEVRKQGDLTPNELAKLSGEARQLIIARERLLVSNYEGAEIGLLEAAFVAESPAWPRVRDALLEALRPHREALEAVLNALEELRGEGHPLCQGGTR